VFGFDLASIDLRQRSDIHETVIAGLPLEAVRVIGQKSGARGTQLHHFAPGNGRQPCRGHAAAEGNRHSRGIKPAGGVFRP
jgi:hypothetical protein